MELGLSKWWRISGQRVWGNLLVLSTFIVVSLHAGSVRSQALGVPQPWEINLQPPGSSIADKIFDLHHLLVWIITGICLFVLGLLLYVIFRYNAKANPNPSRTTHHFQLEVIWTVVPVLILLVIAFPSFQLLYYQDRLPEKTDVTLVVTSHQWYWSYEYPDQGDISFDSRALWDQPTTTNEQALQLASEVSANWLIKNEPLRMLEVDNRVVLPVDAKVKVLIKASDVLHSWFVPALGVNKMSVVGRTNQIWLDIKKEGIYYGQCSLICGTGHAYMPIVIEAVSRDKFDAWVKSKQTAVGTLTAPTDGAKLAAAQ